MCAMSKSPQPACGGAQKCSYTLYSCLSAEWASDNQSLSSWIHSVSELLGVMDYLLSLSHSAFWTQLTTQTHRFLRSIDSYLENAPRSHDRDAARRTFGSSNDEVSESQSDLHTSVFHVLLRMSTCKEPGASFDQEGYKAILQQHRLWTVGRLASTCAVFGGSAGNDVLLGKMAENVLSCLPSSTLRQQLKQFSVFSVDRLTAMSRAVYGSGVRSSNADLLDVLRFSADMAHTISSFVRLAPRMHSVLFQAGFLQKVPNFFESVLWRALSRFCEVPKWRRELLIFTQVTFFNVYFAVFESQLLKPLLDCDGTKCRCSEGLEELFAVIEALTEELYFTRFFNAAKPFRSELFDKLMESKHVSSVLDLSRVLYILSSIEQELGASAEEERSTEQQPVEEKIPDDAVEDDANLQSMIVYVQEMLGSGDLTSSMIRDALKRNGLDLDATVDELLSRVTALQIEETSADDLPCSSSSILTQDDEAVQLVRLAESQKRGRLSESDREVLQKTLVGQQFETPDIEPDMEEYELGERNPNMYEYDDEYDDTYGYDEIESRGVVRDGEAMDNRGEGRPQALEKSVDERPPVEKQRGANGNQQQQKGGNTAKQPGGRQEQGPKKNARVNNNQRGQGPNAQRPKQQGDVQRHPVPDDLQDVRQYQRGGQPQQQQHQNQQQQQQQPNQMSEERRRQLKERNKGKAANHNQKNAAARKYRAY